MTINNLDLIQGHRVNWSWHKWLVMALAILFACFSRIIWCILMKLDQKIAHVTTFKSIWPSMTLTLFKVTGSTDLDTNCSHWPWPSCLGVCGAFGLVEYCLSQVPKSHVNPTALDNSCAYKILFVIVITCIIYCMTENLVALLVGDRFYCISFYFLPKG